MRNKSTYFRDTIDFIFRHTVETDIATCTYPRMFTHHFLWINPHGYRHQSGGWRNKNSWWIWIMMPVYRNQNHPQAKRDSHIVHFDQVHSLLWSGRRAAGPSCNCIVHRSSCSFLSQHPATSMMRPGPRMACLHHYISRLILIVRPQSFPDSQDCLVDRHIVCVLWSFFCLLDYEVHRCHFLASNRWWWQCRNKGRATHCRHDRNSQEKWSSFHWILVGSVNTVKIE